jgi:O-antigen/teichoic acid export membrane protein
MYWLGKPELSPWFGAASLLIVLQPLGAIPLLFLASLQEFRAYALRSSLGIILGAAVTVFMAWRRGLDGAIVGMILAAVLQIGLSIVLVRPALRNHAIQLRFDMFWKETRSILRLGFPYYYGNTLLGSLVVLPVMGLVGRYGGLGDLGFLRVAQSLASIIGFIPMAIAPAALSFLSASLAADVKTFLHLRLAHLRSVWSLLLILTCLACLVLPHIIRILFGATYADTYRLAWISLWLSLLVGVIAILVQYLVVTGRTGRIAWVCTLGVSSFIVASFILVPRYHALGFLVAQLIGQGVSFPLVLHPVLVESTADERRMIRNLVLATLVGLGWTFFVSSTPLSPLMTVGVVIITGGLLSFFLVLRVLSPSERLGLRKLVSTRALYAS